jgi:hypothetical protein
MLGEKFGRKNLLKKDEPLFCMTKSDKIYNYDVNEEECLKDFNSREMCDSITMRSCRPCPKDAICSKGKLVNCLYSL